MATSVTLKPNAIDISGSTSGTTTLQASAVAGTTTLTLPAATDTLVGKATTDTLTNKTLTGAAMNGTLGATTPSTASVTTLTTSSTVTHSGGTANGVAYLDGSKVLTTGSALVFDGTNLGLGVTPSAWSWKALQIGSFGGFFATNTGAYASYLGNNAYYNAGWKYIASTAAVHYEMAGGDGAHRWYNAPSGTAGNAITFTQAMTLDASGNLLVGTTSGSSRLVVSGDIEVTGGAKTIKNGSGFLQLGTTSADYLAFITNSNERARIDSSGNLLVGTTGTPSASVYGSAFIAASESRRVLLMSGSSTATSNRIEFFNPNGSVGKIDVSGSSTTYGTSSDYRLKKDIAPMTGALAKVALLKPCKYKWKVDDSEGEGFIAHELADVCPHAVTGEKDAVNEDGSIKPQAIDTSFLVATLTAAIQEQQVIIQSLTARITALESA